MLYLLIVTYILGGVTFIPLIALAAVAYTFWDSVPAAYGKPPEPTVASAAEDDPHTSSPLKSWLTVRHNFEASPSSYISIVRTLLDARATRTRRAEDTYYAILKGAVLYLYEDEAMSECAAAIDVRCCRVHIVPNDDMLDGELFARRNAVLLREDISRPPTPGLDAKDNAGGGLGKNVPAISEVRDWYIFFRSVHDMEDWYFAFLNAPAPFPHSAQRALIDTLDALPDRIPTRWLNALLGRIFLGIKGTRTFQAWVVGRLMKKISKVKTPSWLTAVVVRSFDAGEVPPILSKPMLKDLTTDGDASVGFDISYVAPQDGGIRITVSATATIALPSTPSFSILGFKHKEKEQTEHQYEVSLVLAVIIRRVEGNMLLKIKRAPSNRVWYAFTTMPSMDIEVKPVVSDRQIRWGMVLSGIEGKLREIIQDSVVLPYMDDIPFFDTSSLTHRGGIFADAFPSPEVTSSVTPEPPVPAEISTEEHYTRSNDALAAGIDTKVPVDQTVSGQVQQADKDEVGVGGRGIATSGSVRRRRTWFGGRHGDEDVRDGDDAEDDDTWETREPETQESRERDMIERRRSEDATAVKVLVTNDEDAQNIATPDRPPLPPRRQTSRSVSNSPSLARDHSPSTSPPDGPGTGLSRSAPSTTVPSPASVSTPSGPSFLTTLKSRGAGMAEKQPALKEAMRKWGGTWAAALRKGEREREKEVEADHGEAWTGWDKTTNQRGSYAELRKKVEQRERERARDGTAGPGTHPIDIPGTRGNESRISLERKVSSSTASISSRRTGSDTSVPNTRASPSGGTQFLTLSAPKTTTELQTSPRTASPTPLRTPPSSPTLMSHSSTTTPFVLADQHTPLAVPAPIRAQPHRAATMTIPGIHEKHRGDLMGFGSVSSDPPPGTAPVETGKTMQSVYQLLRGGSTGSESAERNEEPPVSKPATGTTVSIAHSEAMTPPTTISPASQALKSLAEQDAAVRQPQNHRVPSSPTNTSPSDGRPPLPVADSPADKLGWKPPLPPRPRPLKSDDGVR